MHIVLLHPLQYRVCQVVSLYQHTAIAICTAGTATHLLHDLEGTLIYTEVGKAQQAVGAQYAHQCHRCKVQPFHHHLCAYEYIHLALLQLGEQLAHAVFAPHTVYIHTGHTGIGEYLLHLFFYTLCAKAFAGELGAVALRAYVHHRGFEAAVVAVQFVGALVVGERYRAVAALRYPAAYCA